MTELLQGLKSIVEGLAMQTESDQIKWLNHNQFAKTDEKHSWMKEDKEKLDITLFYQLDNNTLIKYVFFLQKDHVINRSYMSICNDKLQEGSILVFHNHVPELKALDDILYKKYILPLIKSYKRTYFNDVAILGDIVNKCGIEAARDYKINSILDDKKGFFDKLFGS